MNLEKIVAKRSTSIRKKSVQRKGFDIVWSAVVISTHLPESEIITRDFIQNSLSA